MPKFEAFTYDVVSDQTLNYVIDRVNKRLGDGWKPIGGISYGTNGSRAEWAQAMAKPVKPMCEPQYIKPSQLDVEGQQSRDAQT